MLVQLRPEGRSKPRFQHLRRKDPLFSLARDTAVPEEAVENTSGIVLDLNRALAQLGEAVRLCVVLTYHEGLSHSAIAQITGLPLGTVKSHISRGSVQLRAYLAAYENQEALAMSEDRERDLQDWFNRSVQDLPRQPFTLTVVQKVQRKERFRQLQRHAALLVAAFSVGLLLPQLIVPLNMLSALPEKVIDASAEQWPLLVLLVAGLVYWLVNRARNSGFLRGG